MRLRPPIPLRRLARDESGFTMVVALTVMLVGSLLAAAAFLATNEDVALTRTYNSQQKAYFAAVAGVDAYKYQLTANPNYWLTCPKSENPAKTSTKVPVPGTPEEEYEVLTLGANKNAACISGKQGTIVETSGTASGTFRVKSTGFSGGKERSIVATFTHPGFLNYVWESNYEVEDPSTIKPTPINCAHYYKERKEKGYLAECPAIPFIGEDELLGPFHTNDAVEVCQEFVGSPTFGRSGKNDILEMNQGHYPLGGCGAGLNLVGKYTEAGATLFPPETDNELLETAAAEYRFKGRTVIELASGSSPNKMKVTTCSKFSAPAVCTTTKEVNFPVNGVIYAENEKGGECHAYSPFVYDKNYEEDETKPYCGNIYIKGTYTEALTVAAQNDVIIIGSVTTTHKESEPEQGKPNENATLGLIANGFIRIYHPVTNGTLNTREKCNGTTNQTTATDPRKWGALTDPTIDAAILSTEHSWIVDNFTCGSPLGTLTVWGAIAQNWRGRVTAGLGSGGYIKSYNYDERLAAKQPPSFLSPTTTSWHVTRETQPPE
jgi:hypothetical protein